MQGLLVIIGLLIVAGWVERKFSVSHPANVLPSPSPLPVTAGQMPLVNAPTIGNPVTAVLVSGDPSGPGETEVSATAGPPVIIGNPGDRTSGGLMTENTPPIVQSGPTAEALDSAAAMAVAGGSSGQDKLIMTSPVGYEIWQTPSGNTYQVWPLHREMLQAGIMI